MEPKWSSLTTDHCGCAWQSQTFKATAGMESIVRNQIAQFPCNGLEAVYQ